MLAGKVVVVTGGNRGIGLGLARGVARAGASVAIWARDSEASAAAVTELEALGARTMAFQCDVTDEAAVSAAAADTLRALGPIDALFANAEETLNTHFQSRSARNKPQADDPTLDQMLDEVIPWIRDEIEAGRI